MKRSLLATPFLLCCLVIAQSTPPKPAPAPTSSASAAEDVRKVLADRVDLYKKSVGIVVGVVGPQGSKIYSYGKPAKDSSAVLDGDTVFEIGSMTKVFTSLLLADMVQRDEVKLDDPVSKFLPATVKIPERNGRKITLLDLATQTSGLPRMPNNLKPKDQLNPFADYTVEQMYAFLSGYELTRDIGSKYEYSNLGVGLLGHALALRAGMDYEKLVQTRILGPLKMSSTAITLTPEMRSHLAHGHTATLAPVPNWDIPTLAGAGALRSSVNDMLKFLGDNIGLTQTPLEPAMKSMLDVRKPTGAPNLEIAMAWHILTKEGEQIIWHNGGTGGYHSFMGFDPKTRTGVVVLSNATNDIDDIGLHLLDSHYPLAKLTAPKEHHEAKVDPKIFDSYAGHYELQPGAIAEVKRQGDALFIQLTGQPQFQIFPESETDFFLKVVDAQVTFVKGADGKVTNFVLHQGGFDIPAKKTD
jgi:D-alanyl-D-alanine-carboxypeptidase/D-alanyl-D-alanine-endopeptidase